MPKEPLGEALSLWLDSVPVEPAEEYRIAGVYGFGRGLFQRGPIKGAETSYASLNRLHAGDLVMSRLKAFEGAIALVDEEHDGWFLSPEFPTFRPRAGRLDPMYLGLLCRWPDFWGRLRTISRGIGSRRERVHPDDLLRLEVDLPGIDDQRAVAFRLEKLRIATASADDLIAVSEACMQAVTDTALAKLAADLRAEHPNQVRLETLGEWSSGGTPGSGAPEFYDGGIPWAVIGDLNDGVVSETRRTISELGLSQSSAKLVPKGTVMIGMYGSIGKLGLSGLPLAVNQAIACCVPHGGEPAAGFMLSFLRCIRQELVGLGKGGAQQNISQTVLKSIEVPDLDASTQAEFVTRFQNLKMNTETCRTAMIQRRAICRSLLPAALNEAFTSLT